MSLKRSTTGLWKARKEIPEAIRESYGKREEKTSWPAHLTHEQALAEYLPWRAKIESDIDLHKQRLAGTVLLTRQQAKALAGEWYREHVSADWEEALKPLDGWEPDWKATRENLFAEEYDTETGDVRYLPGPELIGVRDDLLASREMHVTHDSAAMLLDELAEMYLALFDRLQRRAAGDHGVDPVLITLPAPDVPVPTPAHAASKRTSNAPKAAVSITELFERYARSGSANLRTVSKWRPQVRNLVEHLGHDDATRPDTIGYVNGLPLLFAEWKAPTCPLAEAYDANLRDYRDTIPQLFDANGFVILSNGLEAVMGASHAPFEVFAPWKRLEEGGPESVGLETMLRATCEPTRFLDLIENFLLFDDARGGLRKVIGKYHQVLGVNRAVDAMEHVGANRGRLGVFWHTQGSGKSLSMVMFAEKVLRRLGGNYTFVIVTDRTELDDQIAGQFSSVGALTKDIQHAQAGSRAHLKELLAGNERYVFTLIQKFSTEGREPMPMLSDRSDVIVITDEAHRSQYDQLAANMRAALPNAAFLGFTGTPLIQGEESRTREVFGDYVSVYDFAQSVKDGATVPLFYEARKPELQLDGDELRAELDALLDEAMLSDEQDAKIRRQFARQYTLITSPDRLDKVAEDVALHFAMRGYRGKGMFVAIDKATAVAMYARVKAAITRLIVQDEERLKVALEAEGAAIAERLTWLRELDMAVVVSQGQNEIDDLRKKGLDILPHRERMQKEDLEAKFKDANDPLRLVFVCAMWITGFDVPSIGTVYLDKPMKNHTLMQTIARANRRAEGKLTKPQEIEVKQVARYLLERLTDPPPYGPMVLVRRFEPP